MHLVTGLSWFNRILLGVMVVGVVWCALTGAWPLAALLLGGAAYLAAAIARAIRGAGSDTSRINAAQPFDERERRASTEALALVGQTAIVVLMAVLIVQAATRDGRPDLLVAGLLILLAAVWGVAIKVAVRRG